MRIAIASDHGGFELKENVKKYLEGRDIEVVDLGTYSEESVDYPAYGKAVANAVASGECENGILICGTGIGVSIAANKVDGIRCCHCSDCYSAKMSRAHNDANMLALGGRVIAPELAKLIVENFVKGEFEGGRHQTRIDMFKIIEQGGQLE